MPNTTNTFTLGTPSQRWANVYTNVATITTLNSDYYYADTFQTSGLTITDNTISARNTNANINFNTTGTGGVLLGNFKFLNNEITNIVSGAVSQFTETGTGYAKFAGTNGVVIPSGISDNRPQLAYREVGMIRFNTELQLVEVFNGTAWTSVAGTSSGVTFNDATQIGIEVVLTLG